MRETVLVFLRLGVIAFGGPAAHIALMREELVRRRGWVTDERFIDLMGATNLIPGPNSTELAIHLGHERARWKGLVAAGVCFIVPAALMVTAIAWAYVEHGSLPAVRGFLYGVLPVIVAIIVHSVVPLLRTVVKNWWTGVLVVAGLVAWLLDVHELIVLVAGGAVGLMVATSWFRGPRSLLDSPDGPRLVAASPLLALATDRLIELFLTFLRIGAVLYGSGYVLIAFLEGDFVSRLHWLTSQQLADAITVGQITPGPVFTTATFVGYVVAGLPGAFLATVAIFLPSFVFVALLTRIVTWLRASPRASGFLDGINATALALVVGVSIQLGREAVVDVWTVLLGLTAFALLRLTKLNSGWLILAGGLVGLVVTGSLA